MAGVITTIIPPSPAHCVLKCRSRSHSQRNQTDDGADGAKEPNSNLNSSKSSDSDRLLGDSKDSCPKDSIDSTAENKQLPRPLSASGWVDSSLLALLITITILTKPSEIRSQNPTALHVWYYGWISALSTGLGAIPFFVWKQPSGRWLGLSNAVAGGMMLSASYSLLSEAFELENDNLSMIGYPISQITRALSGCAAGMGFVAFCQMYLAEHDDITIGAVTGVQATKILLMVGVMTLHSFAEGLGIGASFCGTDGTRLGALISATLAVHNVPEGLAVALVLVPRGVSPLRTVLACVATSLPQPLVAAPSFIFLDACSSWRAPGLGFAAGAMIWVAAFELLPDAARELPRLATAAVVSIAFAGMLAASTLLDVEISG